MKRMMGEMGRDEPETALWHALFAVGLEAHAVDADLASRIKVMGWQHLAPVIIQQGMQERAARASRGVMASLAQTIGEARASVPEPAPKPHGEAVTPYVLDWIATHADVYYAGDPAPLMHLVQARDAFGRQKYGQPLCTGDGRNTEEDLKQELGDALQYAMKMSLDGTDPAAFERMSHIAGVLVAMLDDLGRKA